MINERTLKCGYPSKAASWVMIMGCEARDKANAGNLLSDTTNSNRKAHSVECGCTVNASKTARPVYMVAMG